MSEIAGLLALRELLESGEHDHIVVDTAPFGHTLRLFELPGHFQRFLNFLEVASSRDALLAQRFGGRTTGRSNGFLEEWQLTVRRVKEAFSAEQAEVMLVTSPESFSLNESVRCVEALQESAPEMRLGSIVLNRVVMEAEDCRRCRYRALQAKKAVQFLKRKFPRVPRLVGPDPGNPLLGAGLLQRFGDVVFAGRRANLSAPPPKGPANALKLTRAEWPVAATRLAFTLGKGGVGKTTITAALAFHSRALRNGVHVTVCSTDPAPSLDDVFQKKIEDRMVHVLGDRGLGAMEMDAVSEFRRWAARIREQLSSGASMESGGLHVDLSFEREVFAALMDVVPPGVDEVFAIFRILDLLEAKPGKVFIDMAPTGHALELLRMPERILLWSRLLLKSLAAHRTLALAQDVAVELAGLGQRVRKLLEMMRDPKQGRAWVVMLPEPVPDRQTQRLLAAMKEIGYRGGCFVREPRAAPARGVWKEDRLQSLPSRTAVATGHLAIAATEIRRTTLVPGTRFSRGDRGRGKTEEIHGRAMANPKRKLAAPGALYLYGISRRTGAKGAKKPAAKLAPRVTPRFTKISSAGIDGVHAVRPLECGEFICWVCEVDQASFAQAMERNMENLEWLALHGVRHQQVVGEVAAQMAIVPARFGTIFSGEPALLQDVRAGRPRSTRFLPASPAATSGA